MCDAEEDDGDKDAIISSQNKKITELEDKVNNLSDNYADYRLKVSEITGIEEIGDDFLTLNTSDDTVDPKKVTFGDSIHSALFNHMIVSKIFMNLKPSDPKNTNLRNVRLVCKRWNAVATSQKPPQLVLNVYKYLHQSLLKYRPKPPINFFRLFPIHKSLARSIHIQNLIFKDECYDKSGILGLPIFLLSFGNIIEELDYDEEYRFPPGFVEIKDWLKTNQLKNINTLTAKLNIKNILVGCYGWYEINLKIPELSWLKSINIEIEVKSDNTLLQNLVNVAPNLEHFVAWNDVFVKFGSINNKLKHLEYRKTRTVYRDEDKLREMLDSCAYTLVSLSLLSDFEERAFSNHYPTLPIPKMPLLKRLKMTGEFEHYVGGLMESFGKNLPSLESLSLIKLGNKANKFLEELDSTEDFLQPKLTFLQLNCVMNAEILEDLGKHFPSLKDLDLSIKVPEDLCEYYEGYKDYSESLYDFFNRLNNLIQKPGSSLRSLRICLPPAHLEFDFPKLIFALQKNTALITCLKTLKIEKTGTFTTHKNPMEKCVCFQDFEKILLQIKGNEGIDVYFHNFFESGVQSQRILKFIESNNIHVIFTQSDPILEGGCAKVGFS